MNLATFPLPAYFRMRSGFLAYVNPGQLREWKTQHSSGRIVLYVGHYLDTNEIGIWNESGQRVPSDHDAMRMFDLVEFVGKKHPFDGIEENAAPEEKPIDSVA